MRDQTVVLLHGAGTGAWVWDRVTPLLGAAALPLELGARRREATPASCAAAIVETLDRRGIDRVALVLHSLAGVLAGELAHRLGDRLTRCIYVAAVIPADGSTFARAVGMPQRLLLPLLFRMRPDGLLPSAAMVRRELCADLSEEDTAMVVARYEAEFPGLYLSRVAGPPECSSAYIRLLGDKTLPPARQSAMIRRLRDPAVVDIDCGHLAMLARPKELAAAIDELIASH